MATLIERKLKNGVSYTLQWSINGRRERVALGFISHKSARIKLKQKELDLEIGEDVESLDVPLFVDYAEQYKKWYVIQYPSSYERVQQIIGGTRNGKDYGHLIKYFGRYPLDKITQILAEEYQFMRSNTQKYPNNTKRGNRKIKASTINKELRTLKAMLNRAVNLELIVRNPLRAMKSLQELDSKVPDSFTPEQMKTLYKFSYLPHWWMLLANTGMRVSEAQGMLWSWVGKDTIMIESTGQHRTKSGHWREIPITDNVRRALDAFKQEATEVDDDNVVQLIKPTDHVFTAITRTHFSRLAKQDIARAGLKGSAHKFRHTFCSNWLMQGENPGVVQRMAGHSTSKVTDKYMRLSSDFVASRNINI